MESVFNRFDDDEVDEVPRKRKLVPLDYEDEEKVADLGVAGGGKGVNTEEKRKHIKSLIEKIPTAKPELFNYPLDWSVVDTVRAMRVVLLLICRAVLMLYNLCFSLFPPFLDTHGEAYSAMDQ